MRVPRAVVLALLGILLAPVSNWLLTACLVTAVQASARASEPVVTKVHKLELNGTRLVPLNEKGVLRQPRISIVQANGKRKEVPVVLEVDSYHIPVALVGEGSTNFEPSKPPYCFTLRSLDSSVKYSWSWWTSGPVGPFRLIRCGDTSYLAWLTFGDIHFADVSRPNNKWTRLDQHIARLGDVPDVVRVPVTMILDEVFTWGVNALYSDITIRSIDKDRSGNWVIQISGPKSDKVFTLVSDKKTELGWRLQE